MGSPSTDLVFFITGASRGLGLGMVTGLMAQGVTTVIAAARRPDTSEALQELVDQFPERVVTVAMDTSSEASVKARCPAGEYFGHRQHSSLLARNC